MPTAFTITSAEKTIKLNGRRHGTSAFTVTNTSGLAQKGSAHVTGGEGTDPGWFSIVGQSVRDFAVGATDKFTVKVAVPGKAPVGKYQHRLDISGVANPDELAGEGEWVAFEVLPMRYFPWKWIAIAAAVLLVLGGGGYGVYWLINNQTPAGAVQLSQTQLTLDATVGSTDQQKVTVTNSGTGAVRIHGGRVVGDAAAFTADFGKCETAPLQPQGSCDITVIFKPTEAKTYAANLFLQVDNSARSRLTLPVNGTAIAPTPTPTATAQPTPTATPKPSCPCVSLFPPTPPASLSSFPGPFELGMTFKTDVDGYVVGVRFYKPMNNTGQHFGHLWTSSGVLLRTVQFGLETPSGWQQANFGDPVPIQAGSTYVVSYDETANLGYTDGYFKTTSTIDNPPLHGISSNYSSGGGSFPTSQVPGRNYWVDVAFVRA